MVNKIFLFFVSGGIAVFSYALMIALLIWQFNTAQKIPKAYTTYKETTFSIDLIEEVQPKEIVKVAQKKVEKKVEKIPIKKESASKTANVGVGINDLFKQIDSKMPVKKEALNTLAFVQTLKDGDRDFSFYRNPGADMMLEESEINSKLIKNCRIFHFGTLSMTHKGVRKATKKAIKKAKENGALISFDPNLRPPLWESLEDAKKQVEYGLSQCDILKISDNEIQWFTGEKDFDKGIKKLQDKYDIKLIVLSMGKDGSRAYYKGLKVEKSAFEIGRAHV